MSRDPASEAGATQPQSLSQKSLTHGFRTVLSVMLWPAVRESILESYLFTLISNNTLEIICKEFYAIGVTLDIIYYHGIAVDLWRYGHLLLY